MAKPTPPTPSALSTLITNSGAKSASESLAISIIHNLQYQHNWTDLKLHLIHMNRTSYGGVSTNGALEAALIDLDGLNFNHSNSSSRTASPSRSVTSSSGSTTPTLNGKFSLLSLDNDPSSFPPETVPMISGLPPQHSYIHPDLQTHLLKHNIKDSELQIQREFVLPLALGAKSTLSRFCAVFDSLPQREVVRVLQRPSNQPGRGSGSNGTARANGPARTARNNSVYEHKDQKRVLLGMRANEGMGGDGTVVYYIMQEGEVKPRQNG